MFQDVPGTEVLSSYSHKLNHREFVGICGRSSYRFIMNPYESIWIHMNPYESIQSIPCVHHIHHIHHETPWGTCVQVQPQLSLPSHTRSISRVGLRWCNRCNRSRSPWIPRTTAQPGCHPVVVDLLRVSTGEGELRAQYGTVTLEECWKNVRDQAANVTRKIAGTTVQANHSKSLHALDNTRKDHDRMDLLQAQPDTSGDSYHGFGEKKDFLNSFEGLSKRYEGCKSHSSHISCLAWRTPRFALTYLTYLRAMRGCASFLSQFLSPPRKGALCVVVGLSTAGQIAECARCRTNQNPQALRFPQCLDMAVALLYSDTPSKIATEG